MPKLYLQFALEAGGSVAFAESALGSTRNRAYRDPSRVLQRKRWPGCHCVGSAARRLDPCAHSTRSDETIYDVYTLPAKAQNSNVPCLQLSTTRPSTTMFVITDSTNIPKQ